MKLNIAAVCDLGCVRKNNEDMVLVGTETLRDDRTQSTLVPPHPDVPLVLAVADGMGGAAAGEVASEYVLQTLRNLWPVSAAHTYAQWDGSMLVQRMHDWAAQTHQELCAMGRNDPSRSGMGTTVVGLLFWRSRVWRFHAGDSRLYRLRGDLVEQLTLDHSAQMLEAHATQPRNVLANAMGGGEDCYLECEEIADGLMEGDRFLLCSDGLHDVISPESLVDGMSLNLKMAVSVLLARAHEAGGRDNISIVLADVPEAA